MTDPFAMTWFCIGVAILLGLWVGPLAMLRRDNYRSDIRRIRDDLFDFMWQNGLSYETRSYVEARQILNGMLRWSNIVSPGMFLIAAYPSGADETRSELETHLESCDPALSNMIHRTLHQAIRRTLRFVFLEGTTGVLVRLLREILRVCGVFGKIHRAVVDRSKSLVTEAYVLGATDLSRADRLLLGRS